MSTEAVERLLTILSAEERLYLELRELLQRERDLIQSFDARGVERAMREKEVLAEEGQLLEESRNAVARGLAENLGIEGRPTLAGICDRLGEHDVELRDAHSRLSAVAGAVQELLHANAAFAGEALTRVQGTLQLLGRLLPEASNYQRPGSAQPVSHGRLVRQSA